MAKISLRAYNKEIESLIDRGQIDQALAHCRHILKTYPKHIDTYRLMAKAYIEAQRYGDASDVFQRVLSSIPDDFVSHLGMSIIREDEGNLDAAIWHMERAFEIQPANAAIQAELRRLYGRRDGIEPPKVRLTRGALARMYYKGELYQQAIAELRTALSADVSRTDLQVLLAQAYYRSGQRVESVDTCTAILKKLPYCIEANRILAEILAASDRAQDAPAYRQRAISLNPYLGQVSPRANTPDKVPDEAVWLEKLDYVSGPGESEKSGQPQWAASIGVQLDTPTTTQGEMPDWLNELEAITQAPPAEQTPEIPKVSPFVPSALDQVPELAKFSDKWQEPAKPNDEELIPDWMKEAGWVSSSEPSLAAEQGFTLGEGGASTGDELTPAEIPTWLRAMAPKEALDGTLDESEETEYHLADVTDSSALPWLEETPPGPSDTIANWLEDKNKSGSTYEASASVMPGFEASDEFEPTTFGSGTPDWLQELEKQTGLAEPIPPQASDEGLPDWLKAGAAGAVGIGIAAGSGLLGRDKDESPEAGLEELPPVVMAEQEVDLGEEAVPDWLSEDRTGAVAAGAAMGVEFLDQVQDFTPTEEEIPSEISAPEQGALPWDELVQEGAAPAGEVPDWLKELGEPGVEIAGVEEALAEVEPPIGIQSEWLEEAAAMPLDAAQEPAPDEIDIAEIAGVVAIGAALDTASSEPEETQPDEWVPEAIELPEEAVGIEGLVTQPETPVDESLPEWLRQASMESETGVAALSEDTGIPDWLRQMEEGEEQPGEAELEMISSTEAVSDAQALEWFEAAAELEPVGDEEQVWLTEIPAEVIPEETPEELVYSEAGEEAVLPNYPTDEIEATPETSLPDWLAVAAAGVAVSEFARDDVEEPAFTTKTELASVQEAEPVRDEIPAWLDAAAISAAATEEPAIIEQPAAELTWLEIEEPEAVQGDTEPSRITTPTEVAAIGAVPESVDETISLEEVEISQSELESAALAPADAGLSDAEAAFAWLESLAVRQGADEALMYTDEQRPEEPPDWVKQAALEAEVESSPAPVEVEAAEIEAEQFEDQESGVPGWLVGIAAVGAAAAAATRGEPGEEAQEAGEAASQEIVEASAVASVDQPKVEQITETTKEVKTGASDAEMEAAFAWLESLAVRQGADEALLYTEEERSETPPEWVVEEKALAAEESLESALEMPEVISPVEVEAAQPEELSTTAEITPVGEMEEAIPELPAWLADLDEEVTEPIGEAEWMLPETPSAESYQLDINQASLIELERLPGVGFVRAQALIDYRSTHGPINNLDELAAIEEFDSDVIDGLRGYIFFPRAVQAEPAIPTEIPEAAEESISIEPTQAMPEIDRQVPLTGAEGEILMQARSEFDQANPQAALQKYQELIQSEKLLPEVIKDLHSALYHYPVDISLWMTLGDAQMRSGQIQEALDAYTKAEELMR